MKKTLTLLATLFVIAFSYGQNKANLPALSVFNSDGLQMYFQEYYKIGNGIAMELCVKTVVYARFKVSPQGKINEVDLSKNAPLEIKNAFKNFIMATSGHWKFDENDKKGITDKVFLLPLICVYEAGCSPGLVDSAALKPKTLTDILKQAKHDSMFYNSVQQMMDFESGRYKSLNCILLAPLTTGILE